MDIEKILKQLKNIAPDKKYAENSRLLILASKKSETPKFKLASMPRLTFRNIFETMRLTATVGVGLFLIVVFLGGASYINKTYSPISYEGLDQKSLVAEADEINRSIEITLREISSLDQSNQQAIQTIGDISKNQPVSSTSTPNSSETSTTAATQEIENLLIENPQKSNIDATLEKIAN